MINFNIRNLSDYQKGMIALIVGILLLFNTWDILPSLFNTIFIVISLGLIVYGFIQIGGIQKLRKLLKRDKPQQPTAQEKEETDF